MTLNATYSHSYIWESLYAHCLCVFMLHTDCESIYLARRCVTVELGLSWYHSVCFPVTWEITGSATHGSTQTLRNGWLCVCA